MKKTGVSSILFVVILLAVGVIAEAQQPAKIPLIGVLGSGTAAIRATKRAWTYYAMGCASLATPRGKLSASNTALLSVISSSCRS